MTRRGKPPFASAESVEFLKVPLPVPPMIEQAFGYCGHEQYVSLGFGVQGGVMSDFVGEAVLPQTEDLYRSYLLHPAVKSYTDAFQIEVDPPAWVIRARIEEFDAENEQFESWAETSRCLLLDRKARQFLVGTIGGVRTWLILRRFLLTNPRRRVRQATEYESSQKAEEALWVWLESRPGLPPAAEFIRNWERVFRERQAVSGCIGAGVKLGFEVDDIKRMVVEAFKSPRNRS